MCVDYSNAMASCITLPLGVINISVWKVRTKSIIEIRDEYNADSVYCTLMYI